MKSHPQWTRNSNCKAYRNNSYLEEKLRKERALEWDKKEKQLIEDFKKKRLELLQKNPNLRELDVETNRAILEDIKTKR